MSNCSSHCWNVLLPGDWSFPENSGIGGKCQLRGQTIESRMCKLTRFSINSLTSGLLGVTCILGSYGFRTVDEGWRRWVRLTAGTCCTQFQTSLCLRFPGLFCSGFGCSFPSPSVFGRLDLQALLPGCDPL